jgi:hypothetical protein
MVISLLGHGLALFLYNSTVKVTSTNSVVPNPSDPCWTLHSDGGFHLLALRHIPSSQGSRLCSGGSCLRSGD